MRIFTLIADCKKPLISGLVMLLSFFGFVANGQNKVIGITVSPTQTGTDRVRLSEGWQRSIDS